MFLSFKRKGILNGQAKPRFRLRGSYQLPGADSGTAGRFTRLLADLTEPYEGDLLPLFADEETKAKEVNQ